MVCILMESIFFYVNSMDKVFVMLECWRFGIKFEIGLVLLLL